MPSDRAQVQRCRQHNLRTLVVQLEREGVQSWGALSAVLGLADEDALKHMVGGAYIADVVAREIEWSVHRPAGWLDRASEGPLDD
jgi:hypothetical protein